MLLDDFWGASFRTSAAAQLFLAFVGNFVGLALLTIAGMKELAGGSHSSADCLKTKQQKEKDQSGT